MSVTVTQEITQQTVTVTGNPVENNVTVTVSNARGPAGEGGGGSNSITSATTSDGTANLSISNVTTATAEVTGTLIAPHIHGNLAGSVYAHVRAGENLAKGDPVYISSSHGSGSTLIAEVSKADASNAAKMPAVGIMDAAVALHANGHMVITGTITELDTDGLAINAELYVASGGGMTATPPTARAQPVARVERANANNGAILVKVNGLSASDATPSTLVRRDGNGGASLNGLTLSGTGGSPFTSTLTGGVNFANRTLALPDASGTLVTAETLANSATITASTAVAVDTIVLRDGAGKILTSNVDVSGTTAYAATAAFTYGIGAASAHRTALGSGATGDALFTAASVKAANETLLRTTKIKTTQTDRTLSTTYTTDSDFTIPVAAGKTYRVEFALYTTATNASGFKGQFVIPSVPSIITANANGVGLTTNPGAAVVGLRLTPSGIIGDSTLSRGTSATNGTYHGFFEVTIGATGGDLLFQWAQVTSSADNTSVLANSSVTVIERTP